MDAIGFECLKFSSCRTSKRGTCSLFLFLFSPWGQGVVASLRLWANLPGPWGCWLDHLSASVASFQHWWLITCSASPDCRHPAVRYRAQSHIPHQLSRESKCWLWLKKKDSDFPLFLNLFWTFLSSQASGMPQHPNGELSQSISHCFSSSQTFWKTRNLALKQLIGPLKFQEWAISRSGSGDHSVFNTTDEIQLIQATLKLLLFS